MIGPLAAALALQGLAARVAAAPSGTVHFTFAARPGVCGDGRNIVTWDRDDEVVPDCEPGPVRVSLTVQDRAVTALRTYVGGRWRAPADATDLGAVPAREAVVYLLDVARHDAGRAGRQAVCAAALADSVTVWPDLLALVRDPNVPARTRRAAVFWLGQAAGDAATRGLADLAQGATDDRDVQEAAVFALSQQPHGAGVPALIRIARTHRDPQVRRRAIFWLGQSGDPRAVAFFEELLTSR